MGIRLIVLALVMTFAWASVVSARAQVAAVDGVPVAPTQRSPKITIIDAAGLKKVIKPNGKPLLVNFWATWCDPCREEFPELVKIDDDYRGKIDFVTISLDDLVDIDGAVPQFLTQMKAQMPTYLLNTPEEDSIIASISAKWGGGLPFSILFNPNGGPAYEKMGKIIPQSMRSQIDAALVRAKAVEDAKKNTVVTQR